MTIPEFIYTVLLKPRLLRAAANATLRAMLPRSIRRHGATIYLNPSDPVVSGSLALHVYEKPETRFFLSACQPGMTFLDIGANVGYYSALALARLQGRGSVIALEPDPDSYSYLLKTVAANGPAICLPQAAADRSGLMRLFLNPDNKGDNRLYPNDLARGSIEVAVVTVDSLLAELGVASVDLIKVDVQGYEGHVFRGMTETIHRSPRLTILSEFWPQGLRDAGTDPLRLLTDLEDQGLRLFELMPNGSCASLTSKASLISRFTGRRYTNIVATKPAAF
jgi:FkbM family methyltransferase